MTRKQRQARIDALLPWQWEAAGFICEYRGSRQSIDLQVDVTDAALEIAACYDRWLENNPEQVPEVERLRAAEKGQDLEIQRLQAEVAELERWRRAARYAMVR